MNVCLTVAAQLLPMVQLCAQHCCIDETGFASRVIGGISGWRWTRVVISYRKFAATRQRKARSGDQGPPTAAAAASCPDNLRELVVFSAPIDEAQAQGRGADPLPAAAAGGSSLGSMLEAVPVPPRVT